MRFITLFAMPTLIFIIIFHGIVKREKVFDLFVVGAREGAETSFRILPSLVALMTAIAMFRASGALEGLCELLRPLLSLTGIPSQIVPLALVRPISGSAALAVLSDILKSHGADGLIGRAASVIMGSTETTFYTLAVYCGSVNIKKTRHILPSALTADAVGIITGIWVVRMIFGS